MKSNKKSSSAISPLVDASKANDAHKSVISENFSGLAQENVKDSLNAQDSLAAHQQHLLRSFMASNLFAFNGATNNHMQPVMPNITPKMSVEGVEPSGLQPSSLQPAEHLHSMNLTKRDKVDVRSEHAQYPPGSTPNAASLQELRQHYNSIQQAQNQQVCPNGNGSQFPHTSYMQNDGANIFMNGQDIAEDEEEDEEMVENEEGEKQKIHYIHGEQFKQIYLLGNEPDRKDILDELFGFMQRRGTPINRVPIMAKNPLDLYKLFKQVVARGGILDVVNKKLWREITKSLNLPITITSAAFTLRTQYCRYLYPFECHKHNLSRPVDLQTAVDNNKREGKRNNNYVFDANQATGMPLGMFPPNSITNASLLRDAMLSNMWAATPFGTIMNARGFPGRLPTLPPNLPAAQHLPNMANMHLSNMASMRPGHGHPYTPTGDYPSPAVFPENWRDSAFTPFGPQRKRSPGSISSSDGKKLKQERLSPVEQKRGKSSSPKGCRGKRGSLSSPCSSGSIISAEHQKGENDNQEQMVIKMTFNGIIYEGVLHAQCAPDSPGSN